jgi:hypothetical protein
MKKMKIYLLFFVSLVSYNAFSQDTICGYIKSSCLQFTLPMDKLPDVQFKRMGDVISISGMIQANCAGVHLAIVNRSGDSIFVTSKDTGQLATCSCIYLFDLSVGVSATTKILVFNSAICDLRALADIINVPDTISGYFTSTCKTIGEPYPDPQFQRLGDSISISGMIGANCAGTHIAIISRSGDSIFVTSMDTGQLATCSCVYTYNLKVKVSLSDSILVFNQMVYNLNSVIDGIEVVNQKDDLIDVYYDPTIESLRIEQKSGVVMNSVSIYDNVGCLKLSVANDRSIIDMSGYKSGLYILEFVMVDNRHITRKIMKK